MHASKVSLSKHSSDPQLLRVYVCSNQVISRWYLHHGLQLTAYPVSLNDTQKKSPTKLNFSTGC